MGWRSNGLPVHAGSTNRLSFLPGDTSDRPTVVSVSGAQKLRTRHSGVATVSVAVTYRGHTARTSFVVNVAPLTITSAPTATLTAGTPGTVTATTATTQSPTAAEVPQLSYTGTLPAGLHLSDNGDGTATISGTPSKAGAFPVTVVARNHVSPVAKQQLTLTVNAAG